MKVSVIIPVFNVEYYLAECLDSVISQSLIDIELICVNDCSTDNSLHILKDYQRRDNRIKIINLEVNRGLSHARNIGILHSEGKYVFFVDSDDMLMKNALMELFNIAEREGLDGVLFDSNTIYESEELRKVAFYNGKRQHDYTGIKCGMDLFAALVNQDEFESCVWRQFWNKEFLLQNKLLFYEGILHEDRLFTFMAILKAERMECINRSYYIYRKRNDAITTVKTSYRNIEGKLISFAEMLAYWNEHRFDDNVDKAIKKYMKEFYINIQSFFLGLDEVEKNKIMSFPNKIAECLNDILMLHKPVNKQSMRIDHDKLEYIKTFDKVIIYGAGAVGKETLSVFHENDIPILGFAVTEINNNSNSIMGNRVYELKQLLQYKNNSLVVVAVTTKYQLELINNLRLYGFINYICIQ